MGKKKGGCCPSWKITSPAAREFLAECSGTFILVVFGCGSIAQSVLSLGTKGDFFSINWGWCLGVTLGILVSGGVSGGHLNPAVTVALATLGKIPWRKVPHYLAGQYLGAFLASFAVFLVYWDALVWYEHDRGGYRITPDTASIFGTYPSHHLTYAGGVGDQVLGTALLLLCICAITDKRNMQVSKQLVPFFVGLTVLGIGICFGYNCGYAVNPARDFAPRLLSALAGWGLEVFTYSYHWWVVPILATHLGAVLGAWIYYLAIELNWPKEDADAEKHNGMDPAYAKLAFAPQAPPLNPHDHHNSHDHHHGHHQHDDVKHRSMPPKDAFKNELKNKINK